MADPGSGPGMSAGDVAGISGDDGDSGDIFGGWDTLGGTTPIGFGDPGFEGNTPTISGDDFYGGWETADSPLVGLDGDDPALANMDEPSFLGIPQSSFMNSIFNIAMPNPLSLANIIAGQFDFGIGDIAQGDPDPAFGTGVDSAGGGPGVGGGPTDEIPSNDKPASQGLQAPLSQLMSGLGLGTSTDIEDTSGFTPNKPRGSIAPAHTNLYRSMLEQDMEEKQMREIRGTMIPTDMLVSEFSL